MNLVPLVVQIDATASEHNKSTIIALDFAKDSAQRKLGRSERVYLRSSSIASTVPDVVTEAVRTRELARLLFIAAVRENFLSGSLDDYFETLHDYRH